MVYVSRVRKGGILRLLVGCSFLGYGHALAQSLDLEGGEINRWRLDRSLLGC